MAVIQEVQGKRPQIAEDCFLAVNATILGDVVIGEKSSIWFNAVLRGDVNSIRLGKNVNIQDGCVLHTNYGKSVIDIADNVSVGHNVTLHGCTIEEYALIGMGAVVLDNAVVGRGSIVAAGSVVLANTIIEPNTLWAGAPARKIKDIAPEQSKELNERIANSYYMYASWYSREDNPPATNSAITTKED